MLELNKIHCGDCLELIKGIPDNSIDAVITDPPFTMAGGLSNGRSSTVDTQFFDYWWRAVCNELVRVLKPEAEGFIWCDWKTAPSIANGFKPKIQEHTFKVSQMIYHYREMPGQGQPFRSSVDMIAYLRGPKSAGDRIPNTTHNMISKYWYYGKHEYHPAEKDTEICKQLIEWCSNPNDIIIDPFAGSGSSLIAAKLLNRQYLGIELEEMYCDIASKRLDCTASSLIINGKCERPTLDMYSG